MRNIIGALSSQSLINHGGVVVSYLFGSVSESIRSGWHVTYNDDFLQIVPSRLLIPDETLNTSEMNQNRFTTFHRVECVGAEIVIWRVVAVTLEKNVAIVVMLTSRMVAFSFSSARNCGSAIVVFPLITKIMGNYGEIPLSPKPRSSSTTIVIAFSNPSR